MKALVDSQNSSRPIQPHDSQTYGLININLKSNSNTQSYTSFGNHNLNHQASFGDKDARAGAVQVHQGATCSTARSQVSEKLVSQGSQKVLDILASGFTKKDDVNTTSSLCEGSVRGQINFEGSIGQELATLNNSTQMTIGQGSTESRAQLIMTPIYEKRQVKEEEAKPAVKCTVKTKSPSASRNASKTKQAPAQGKTVATYRHDVDTGSVKGSRRSSVASQSHRGRPKSGSSVRGSKKRNSRSKSQRSNGHFNEQIKALMKGNRQQPLVKVPKPGHQKQRHTDISTVFSNDDHTEISGIEQYSSGSESARYFIQPESHLNERALEIQMLEQQRQEIAESNRVRQQEIAELHAEKEKDSEARDFINQAFDNFKDQFHGNPLTQRAGSRVDLALSETDNDENDYNYLNMPQQIHNAQNGRLSKLTHTEKSNFYDLTQSPLPYQDQSQNISDVRHFSHSGESRRASDVSAPSDRAPAPRTAQVVKEELAPQPDPRPVIVLAESQAQPLSSHRTSRSNQNSCRSQRTNALSQRQKSPLVATNSARADSARRRLDTMKESARTHKTKACGVLKKAQVQSLGNSQYIVRPSKVLLIEQSKPKLPKQSKKALNNTAHVGQRRGSMRQNSKSRSNSRNKTHADIRDTSATRTRVAQSSKGFGSSFIMSVARKNAPNEIYNNEIDNQIYSAMKPSAAQSERATGPQRLASDQGIAGEVEEGSQDPDTEFVHFLKNIQLYCQQAGTPRSRDGHHLYDNLQFLRERYQRFSRGSGPASARGVDEQQQFQLKHLEEYLKSGNYNEQTRNQVLNEDLRSLAAGPQAEFRSHEYPALLTSLSFEDASLSSAAVQPRGANHHVNPKDNYTIKVEPPSQNESYAQAIGLGQTKTKQQPRKAKQDIPEKHQKQIDFIDSIYNQVVLKKDSRQEKKKNDKALGLEAQAKIKEIQKNYPQRDPADLAAPSQTRTYDSRTTQNYTTHQTQQSQSQSTRSKKSSVQRYPNEFSLNKAQHRQQPRLPPAQSVDSEVNRDQYSGYFQQPSVQGQDITVPRFEMLNQDLNSVADSLRATEDLKRVCEELHRARRATEEQSSHLQTMQSNRVDSLSNPMLIHQHGSTQSHNDTAPHFTHTTRANHLSQTLESYDGQILSQHTCITPHTLRQTISDDNNDLVAQVQMLQQRIGDPRALSAAQLGETLAALTQTANELKKACEGISEFTQVLGQAHTTGAFEQQNPSLQVNHYPGNSITTTPNDLMMSGELQYLPQGTDLTRNAFQMELQQHTANTHTSYELTQTQQTAERDRQQYAVENNHGGGFCGGDGYDGNNGGYRNTQQHQHYPSSMLSSNLETPKQYGGHKYAEEPNIQHANGSPAVTYVDSMSDLPAHGLASRPAYVDSVCDILPGGQPGAQAGGLLSLGGQPVTQSQMSYLQTNANQSSFIHTEAGHQASAPQLEQQHVTWGHTVGRDWHGERLADGQHHHELLSRSIDSFANSDNQLMNQGGTAPSNHHSQPTQDKDSYMSMNPALMVRNSQPALPSSPRLYEQTQSYLQTPSREVNTTNRDFGRRPSANLVPTLRELPSDKRSQYTYTKSNFIDQDQGYLLSKSPATATVNTSRLHSLYGKPGEIKYVESSKESSQYGLLSSRGPSGILDSAHEYEITQTYRSGTADAYKQINQVERDAAIEEQRRAAKRAQLAQAYPNPHQAPSLPYPEQQTPKQYVNTDHNTMRSQGQQPSDIAASAGRDYDVGSEQTLSPDEFEKAMKERADDSMLLKGYLQSTSGDEGLNFLAQESSAKDMAQGHDQLSSPPAMSPATRPASGAIPLQQVDSSTYLSTHQDFRLAASASQPCHSFRSPGQRSTGGYYSNLLPQQPAWPSSLQHSTLDNAHPNQRQ